MGLVGGYSSEEEDDANPAASQSSGAPGAKAAAKAAAEASEEDSSEEEEPAAKRLRGDKSANPLGLLPPKLKLFADPVDPGKKAIAAVTAFVPPQARKTGRVVSTVTDNISDRSFATSKPAA
mmetsp:Transcript_57581/g.134930  ORF Transcript_57581/g.134930 Transcript_57581/m.134930 type:complete len:122 (-) Transcript_57581:45-410(-)